VTPAGKPAYIFQSDFEGRSLRLTIGSPDAWSIPEAQTKARELQRQIDEGRDPREVKAAITAADVAKREDTKRKTATVGEAWAVYIAERRPNWSKHHIDDHLNLAQVGGEVRSNRKLVPTIAGPLAELMPLPLRDVDAALVQAWAIRETPKRPARVRLALRLLKAFLRWCAAEPAYKDVTEAAAASGTKTREAVGKSKPKNDHLQREQLGPWFDSVRGIQNPVIAAYLQCLLLTGARREELAGLRWDDVNFQWKSIAMKDKIEGERMVPLTPFVASLLTGLPRRNEWVFSAPAAASGRLAEPSIAHRRACAVAGLEGLTLHGLRRSFASLCEWLDIPGGISAQIQGHAPQGVREQNYIRRPLDLLRMHHEKIEAWMLEQAGIAFDPAAAGSGGLKLVASA
jgi:integrase